MKNQPKKAIVKGFTSQLTNSVTPMPLMCWRTSLKALKSTFTNIGIIITQISRPTGRLTLAISILPMLWNRVGNSWPNAMPTTMHKNTQTVR